MTVHGAAIKRQCASCQDYNLSPYPSQCYSCPTCYVCSFPTATPTDGVIQSTATPGKESKMTVHSKKFSR